MLSRKIIIEKVEHIEGLPAFPAVVQKIEAELASEDPSLANVGKWVSEDPTIAAHFLKIANSPLYCGRVEVTSVSQAVMRLGMKEARSIVTATAILNTYGTLGGEDPGQFWLHSLAVGLTARAILKIAPRSPLPQDQAEATFTAGLLHDLGVMVLFYAFPEEYAELSSLVKEIGGAVSGVEEEVWEITHGEVGGILARRWGLPAQMREVVEHHHQPWAASEEHRPMVQLIHLANFICNNQGFSRNEEGFPEVFDQSAWDAFGFELEMIPEIIKETREQAKNSSFFRGAIG